MSRLRAMDADVEQALEQINVPAYVIDTHGIIRWVNPCGKRLVGDVTGRQFTSVVAPEETRRARVSFAQKVVGNVKSTDEEVRRIVTDAYTEVVALLTENRGRLDSLARALLEHETLDEDDAYAAAGVTRPQATPAEDLAVAARSRV